MPETKDVVTLLKEQHTAIRALLDQVPATKGDERQSAFQELVRLLAVHETAEAEIVHPFARKNLEGGEAVVNDRVAEEEKVKRALVELEDKDTDSPEFLDLFAALRQDVLAHADAEERHELAHLQNHADRAKLENLATAVKAAEAVAPTRPHPGLDTPAKHLVAGPFAAIADRTRDAIRAARKRPTDEG
ncbi:hemerythrin domain-containing protein [Streptomyces sp. E11-3]|uniref:hemerythrin domain-containing protein n=1 Tax=Streptomyces sp. E11-3 TaxID=3110112 RepID=UPI00397E9367